MVVSLYSFRGADVGFRRGGLSVPSLNQSKLRTSESTTLVLPLFPLGNDLWLFSNVNVTNFTIDLYRRSSLI